MVGLECSAERQAGELKLIGRREAQKPFEAEAIRWRLAERAPPTRVVATWKGAESEVLQAKCQKTERRRQGAEGEAPKGNAKRHK